MILTWPIRRQEAPPRHPSPASLEGSALRGAKQQSSSKPKGSITSQSRAGAPQENQKHLRGVSGTKVSLSARRQLKGVGSESANSIEVVVVRREEDACERA